ncbi:MAG TPA: ABC transporter permease [Candidatus Angelobacter sp.]|jgi:putative ABC transport system permease protein
MNKMIVSNLVYRPVRTVISILAVAIEVTMILLMVGLMLGILEDSKVRQKGLGADVIVRPPGSANFGAFSGAPASLKYADLLGQQPHVAAVAPVMLQTTTSLTNIEVLNGIDLSSFEAVGGPLKYLKGGPFQGPYDMIVDDVYSAANKARVGSTINVLNHDFRVSGIVPHGRGARRYIPMKTLQDLIGADNKASVFYVKVDDAKNIDATVDGIKAKLPDFVVTSTREWMQLMTPDNIPGLSTVIKVVIGIAVVIGFIVIFQSMYTAVMERTREIGILKSLGASKGFVVRVILRETLLLAVAGILVGFIASILGRVGLVHRFPTLTVLPITLKWGLYSTLIAIVGALLGAIYPAIKAAQKDPIDALAYE